MFALPSSAGGGAMVTGAGGRYLRAERDLRVLSGHEAEDMQLGKLLFYQ